MTEERKRYTIQAGQLTSISLTGAGNGEPVDLRCPACGSELVAHGGAFSFIVSCDCEESPSEYRVRVEGDHD